MLHYFDRRNGVVIIAYTFLLHWKCPNIDIVKIYTHYYNENIKITRVKVDRKGIILIKLFSDKFLYK